MQKNAKHDLFSGEEQSVQCVKEECEGRVHNRNKQMVKK